jgi:hypothetical protein
MLFLLVDLDWLLASKRERERVEVD